MRAHACSSATPETLDYDHIEESGHNKPTYRTSQDKCGTSQFSLLMQNINVLESTFSDLDALMLEQEILLQLGRIGALKLFNTCLSRTLEASNIFDLTDVPTECIEEHKINNNDLKDDHEGKVVIRSKRKEKRKSRNVRVLENVNKACLIALPSKTTAQKRIRERRPDSRSRRSIIARNEAEMSRGVKVCSQRSTTHHFIIE